jgi:hypothetical protein
MMATSQEVMQGMLGMNHSSDSIETIPDFKAPITSDNIH